MFMEKKVCVFELCLVFINKYTFFFIVFWREKSFNMKKIFSHQKSSISFVLTLGAVQTCRNFFLSAILHTQKKVKEIAYILAGYQALLKAQLFFSLFVQQ